MEILIPGLILVGFMVWASTRIKRNAARAFEREDIDTSDFSLIKPDGFLAVAEPPDGLLFSAYSKEFGTGEAESIRRATAEVIKLPAASIGDVIDGERSDASRIVEESSGIVNEMKYAYVVLEESRNGVESLVYTKSYFTGDAVVRLSATCLKEHATDFTPKLEGMLASFIVK